LNNPIFREHLSIRKRRFLMVAKLQVKMWLIRTLWMKK